MRLSPSMWLWRSWWARWRTGEKRRDRSPGNEQSVVGGLKPIGLDRQMILIGDLVCSGGLALWENDLVPNHGPLMNKASPMTSTLKWYVKTLGQDIVNIPTVPPHVFFFQDPIPKKNTPRWKGITAKVGRWSSLWIPWDIFFSGNNIPRKGEVRVR